MQTVVHASWVDGDVFSRLWEPLPAADEFLLLSCYVSATGWGRLERYIRTSAKENPRFHARLIFSHSGMQESELVALVTKVVALTSAPTLKGRVRAFIMLDVGSALFHPKAHGSSAGGRTRVVVGSANLTAGGMDRNYELMTSIEDMPDAYHQFRQAVVKLEASGQLREITGVQGADIRGGVRRLRSGARGSSQGLSGSGASIGGQQPAGPFLPPAPDAQAALQEVRALAQQGVFLIRADKPDSLVVPVPLEAFRKAKLIADQSRKSVGALEVGQGTKSISVALVPRAVIAALNEFLDPLGRLVGRHSVETLGGRWMPIAWSRGFEEAWRRQAGTFSIQGHTEDIEEHIDGLPRLFTSRGRERKQFIDALAVQRPKQWDFEAARRLLEWEPGRVPPINLTRALREEVIDSILEHVKRTVGRRASKAYVHAQLASLGLQPYKRVAGSDFDVSDAILFLADWVQAAVEPRLKSADGEISKAPNRSQAVQVLAGEFRQNRIPPEDAWDCATCWQSDVIKGAADKPLDEVLVAAWGCFLDWFAFDATRSPWERTPPPSNALLEELVA
jgi:hypothetical protein